MYGVEFYLLVVYPCVHSVLSVVWIKELSRFCVARVTTSTTRAPFSNNHSKNLRSTVPYSVRLYILCVRRPTPLGPENYKGGR